MAEHLGGAGAGRDAAGAARDADGAGAGGGAGPLASPRAIATPPERVVVAFSNVLRGAGVEVPVGSVITFAAALGAVGLGDRQGVYWAGRATLVLRPEDRDLYDRVFAAFFDRHVPGVAGPPVPTSMSIDLDAGDDEAGGHDEPERDDRPDEPSVVVRYSPVELLRHQDFAVYSEADWAESRRLMARLRVAADLRRSRRTRPSKARHGDPDVARTVRRALTSDGEPIRRAWRASSTRPRRVVYLVDISGSMQPYARAFLRLAHASVSARPSGAVEVFALGTRLTRITRQLSWRDPDAALADAGRAVDDWYGGTRLGDGLREFNSRWGSRGMARGAVVVILSDGWDRGDPAELADQMGRLRRVARRIVWVNPLKASPGYSPVARGMAAALPFVDDFVEGHSIASLEALAAAVDHSSRGGGPTSPVRRHRGGSGSSEAAPPGIDPGLHAATPAR